MPITGGIKFFEKQKNLFINGSGAVASNNNELARYILNNNKYVRWETVGSDDLTTETITITFGEAADIDRLFLLNMNWKEFTVQYDVGGVPTDFTNVLGINGSLAGGIDETTYTQNTAYYEFDKVNTDKIYITVTTTQIPNQEKLLERLICTVEMGTFEGYPEITKEELDQNIDNQEVLSGNADIQKRLEVFNCQLSFKKYPAYQNDYDLIRTLDQSPESFLIWLCGGRFGKYFSIERDNWKLKDVYLVQTNSSFNFKWNNNIYIAGYTGKIRLTQSTDIR